MTTNEFKDIENDKIYIYMKYESRHTTKLYEYPSQDILHTHTHRDRMPIHKNKSRRLVIESSTYLLKQDNNQ